MGDALVGFVAPVLGILCAALAAGAVLRRL